MKRAQIDRALAGLELLEDLGGELAKRKAPLAQPGVIELQEVSPGVFAAPARPARAADAPSLAARARAALKAFDAFHARAKERE